MPSPVVARPLDDTVIFKPLRVGNNELSNRIVFAPSTRFRALPDHSPSDLQLQYYDERSKYPGTLITVEGTLPTKKTGSYAFVPGIYTEKHAREWKKVTDRIHKNKSFVTVQLWGLGRVADPFQNKREGEKLKGPSALYDHERLEKAAKKAGNEIEAYTTDEVDDLIEEYLKAGRLAVEAGFDYVEFHCAHGYLFNQFFAPSANQRTDKYGGSIENRARFILSVIDRLSNEIGSQRLAVRISPWATVYGIKAQKDEDHPITIYSHFLHELQKRADAGKPLAYVSIVEPRVSGIFDVDEKDIAGNNDFVKNVWKGVVMKAGNYTYDAPKFKQLLDDTEDGRTMVGFSRYFISNPDLVTRLKDGKELNAYDRKTFYKTTNWGYNTYNTFGEATSYDEDTEKSRKAAPIDVSARL